MLSTTATRVTSRQWLGGRKGKEASIGGHRSQEGAEHDADISASDEQKEPAEEASGLRGEESVSAVPDSDVEEVSVEPGETVPDLVDPARDWRSPRCKWMSVVCNCLNPGSRFDYCKPS